MKTLLMLALCGLAWGAGDEAQITDAEKQWAGAVVAGRFDAVERALADGLIYAHSTGIIEGKSEYLGKLRGGTQKYTGIEHQSIVVKMYGNAAVAHSKVRMTGRNAKGPFDDRLMMLHIWVRQGGRWQLAAHQTTKLE